MSETASYVAQKLYQKYKNLAGSPGAMIDYICNEENIAVDNWTFPNEYFSGMLWKRNGQYVIVLNDKLPRTRKLFTVAHELGHYFLHRYMQPSFFCQRIFGQPQNLRERQANAFAAEILMPKEVMMSYIGRQTPTKNIARGLGVSEEAVKYRIKDLTN